MQVCHQVLYLFLVELVGEAGHHIASTQDALFHVLIGRSKAAGQILFLKELLQPGAFVAFGRIGRVAVYAVDVKDASALRLLLVQSQFSVGHLCWIFAATGQNRSEKNHQKNGRCSPQMTIMSGAQRFENPWGPYCGCFDAG